MRSVVANTDTMLFDNKNDIHLINKSRRNPSRLLFTTSTLKLGEHLPDKWAWP